MAVYKSNFENKYEKNLTTDIDGKENVDVTGITTLNYKNGLVIDASGKTFYRKSSNFKIDSPNRKLDYNTSNTYIDIQAGFATVNYQANLWNWAQAKTWKTETSTFYNLRGYFFLNPSPIKIMREGAKTIAHKNSHDYELLYLGKGGLFKAVEKISGKAMFGLCLIGL